MRIHDHARTKNTPHQETQKDKTAEENRSEGLRTFDHANTQTRRVKETRKDNSAEENISERLSISAQGNAAKNDKILSESSPILQTP